MISWRAAGEAGKQWRDEVAPPGRLSRGPGAVSRRGGRHQAARHPRPDPDPTGAAVAGARRRAAAQGRAHRRGRWPALRGARPGREPRPDHRAPRRQGPHRGDARSARRDRRGRQAAPARARGRGAPARSALRAGGAWQGHPLRARRAAARGGARRAARRAVRVRARAVDRGAVARRRRRDLRGAAGPQVTPVSRAALRATCVLGLALATPALAAPAAAPAAAKSAPTRARTTAASAAAKATAIRSRPIAQPARHDGAHARVAINHAGDLRPAREVVGRREEPLTAEEDTARQIEKLLRGPLRYGVTGLFVADARTGEALFSVNADDALNPASNVKMISTATALELLGADFRYPTRLFGATPDAGVVHGDVYLLGSYDPTLTISGLDD